MPRSLASSSSEIFVPKRTSIATTQLWGASVGLLPLTGRTLFQTLPLHSRIKRFRARLTSTTNVTTPFKLSVSPAYQTPNGYAMQNSAGTAVVPIQCTVNGDANLTFSGASGSVATNDLVQAELVLDWIDCDPNETRFLHGRVFSTTNTPCSTYNTAYLSDAGVGAGPVKNYETGFMQGQFDYDATATAAPGAGSLTLGGNAGLQIAYDVVFDTDEGGVALAAAGDSIWQGHGSGSTGNVSGFPRLLRDQLIDNGVQCELMNLCLTSEKSPIFHHRALRALQNKLPTHMIWEILSPNDSSFGADHGVDGAIARSRAIWSECRSGDVVPMPGLMPGIMGLPPAALAKVMAHVAEMRAQGVFVLDMSILCMDSTRRAWRTGESTDLVHPDLVPHKRAKDTYWAARRQLRLAA